MSGIREGYIDVPGGKVWYRKIGEEREMTPLLVLHGGPGAPHDYLELLEALQHERPVVFYDQLGCGNSDMPDNLSLWTVSRYVEELQRVRQVLGLDKVHILGQSWGSMLAVDYLLEKKPAGVSGLIFSGPCLSISRFLADQREWLSMMPRGIQTIIEEKEASGDFDSPEYQEAMMSYYRRHVCRLHPWPDCLERTMDKFGHSVYRHMWGPSEFTMTGSLGVYERAERLKELTAPILFTCGRYDEATPEATAYYHGMNSVSEMVIFENASHEHHLERPHEYLEVLRDFLYRVEDGYRSRREEIRYV
ncbi:MAG: proline iminopeptidase-family hydrolase [Syntrophobacteraceae bacterium]